MKIKMLSYCQERMDGCLQIFCVNKIYDLSDENAIKLIDKKLAIKLGKTSCAEKAQDVLCENKMVELIKKRGKPKKEEEK
jgi:hypothetical protein